MIYLFVHTVLLVHYGRHGQVVGFKWATKELGLNNQQLPNKTYVPISNKLSIYNNVSWVLHQIQYHLEKTIVGLNARHENETRTN